MTIDNVAPALRPKADMPLGQLLTDCVAKVVLQEASKILSAAGAFFV